MKEGIQEANDKLPDGVPDNVMCPALHPQLSDAGVNKGEPGVPLRELLQGLHIYTHMLINTT
jgi:hypothetical protein